MLNYVKFLKEVMSNKKKLEAYDIVILSENCSALRQKKLLEKLKDLCSFTIPYKIGEHSFSEALCDLGASINLMPLFVVEKLKLGKLEPMSLPIQMTDRSLKYLKGIIEDVLVKVEKFVFPIYFSQ